MPTLYFCIAFPIIFETDGSSLEHERRHRVWSLANIDEIRKIIDLRFIIVGMSFHSPKPLNFALKSLQNQCEKLNLANPLLLNNALSTFQT